MSFRHAMLMEVKEKQSIKASLIIEILGAPKHHVEETLKRVIEKLKAEKGVNVVGVKPHSPKEQGKFFSVFAEIDAEFESIDVLSGVCFDYMPSSVEIVEPEELMV